MFFKSGLTLIKRRYYHASYSQSLRSARPCPLPHPTDHPASPNSHPRNLSSNNLPHRCFLSRDRRSMARQKLKTQRRQYPSRQNGTPRSTHRCRRGPEHMAGQSWQQEECRPVWQCSSHWNLRIHPTTCTTNSLTRCFAVSPLHPR